MFDPAKVEHLPTGHALVYAPDHPVAHRHGYVYRARAILYEMTKDGPIRCENCGARVTWPRLRARHLNGDASDDRPENLAPRCFGCAGIKHAVVTIELDGTRDTIAGWARRTGLTKQTIRDRLKRGWKPRETLTVPWGEARPAPPEQGREGVAGPPGVGFDFSEATGDRAPPATRDFVDLGSEKPKRSELDG